MRQLDPECEERNYAKVPLEESEVLAIVDVVGDVATVLNTRHAIAKEKGWKAEPRRRSPGSRRQGSPPSNWRKIGGESTPPDRRMEYENDSRRVRRRPCGKRPQVR